MENKPNDIPIFSDEKSFQDFEFDSTTDFSDIGAHSLNNQVSSINVEEYAFQELDLEAKYRSIQTVNPSGYSAYTTPTLNSMAPPPLMKASSSSLHTNPNQLLTKVPPPLLVTKSSPKPVVVPEQPFHIGVAQFTSTHDIDTVISMIDYDLSSVMEVSFKFDSENCRWDCVYLCGPSRCRFEFNVYKNGHGSFIIEGNRLCGDSFPFSTIFRNIRSKFSSSCSSPDSVMNFQFIPLSENAPELSSAEIADAVEPILAMADSGKCESQVNAAQIFCDLSLQQNMLEVLCQPKCVLSLVSLCKIEFNFCGQHAMCALANLSSSRTCQEVLLEDDCFLQMLLQLVCCNGCHNTVEMRRECARLLANLCSAQSSVVKLYQQVGQNDVGRWMDSVADMKDERLRLHAERAKQSFQHCLC